MKLLAGGSAAFFPNLSIQAAGCTFAQLEIVPQFGSPNIFDDKDECTRMIFSDEGPSDDSPDTFPEPPVYLAGRDSGNDYRVEGGSI